MDTNAKQSNLLYFPYINVPNNDWTTQALLYFDNVGVITPSYPYEMSPFMQEATEIGLVKQIHPNYYGHQIKFNEFQDSISSHRNLDIKIKQFQEKNFPTMKIHKEKFDNNIFQFLKSVNLAVDDTTNSNWYIVDKEIGVLLIQYWAVKFGDLYNYIPSTDDISNMPIPIGQNSNELNRNKIRDLFLSDLIPYPAHTPLSVIANILEIHKKDLINFRAKLEIIINDISKELNKKNRDELINHHLTSIRNDRNRLIELFKENKVIKIGLGTIFFVAAEAFITYKLTHEIKPPWISGSLSVLKDMFQNYQPNPIKSEDYAYLAILNKKIKN